MKVLILHVVHLPKHATVPLEHVPFPRVASVLRKTRVCIMQVIQNDKASQNHKYNTTIIQVSNQLELSQYNKGKAVTLNKIIVKIERKDEEKERTYKEILSTTSVLPLRPSRPLLSCTNMAYKTYPPLSYFYTCYD